MIWNIIVLVCFFGLCLNLVAFALGKLRKSETEREVVICDDDGNEDEEYWYPFTAFRRKKSVTGVGDATSKAKITLRREAATGSAEKDREENRKSRYAKKPSRSSRDGDMSRPSSKNVRATRCRPRSERLASPPGPSPASECPAPRSCSTERSESDR